LRRQLFIPNVENPKKVEITPFVIDLFQEIDYHGLMRTYHIFETFPTHNKTNLYVKLGRLFDNRYLGRENAFDYRKHRKKGSLPLFYWLRPKAKYELAKANRPYTGKMDYDPPPPALQNLEHDLATTTFMVKVRMYCLRHGLRFISHYEVLANAPHETQAKIGKKADSPFRFTVNAVYNGTFYDRITATPDKVFGIERQDMRKAYFFPEICMGLGQPHSRSTPSASSVRRKHVVYDAVFEQDIHKKQLNIPNFRVPFITTKGIDHAKNIIEETRTTKGKNIFYSGVLKDIEDPFTYLWETRTGEMKTFLQ
jgi:hypothetical protein